MLIASQPEVEGEQCDLERGEQEQTQHGALRPAPPPEGRSHREAGERPERDRDLERPQREHAQPLAVGQQRPADRIPAGHEQRELAVALDPVGGEHVQQREGCAIGPQRRVRGDLIDLAAYPGDQAVLR